MYQIVLIRHGQSEWNRDNRFTGWHDVDLTKQGIEEAKFAAKLLREEGFSFDMAFTSVLKRAIRTLWVIMDELDLMWIPVTRAWQLNERHYGALQGLNKAETAAKHGDAQVKIWRRSFDVPPPPLDINDQRHPSHDPRYANLRPDQLPSTESLKETIARVIPYWEREIIPNIKAGKRIIVAAHGNTLRSLVKHLDNISNGEILERNVPTGVPLVYDLDEDMRAVGSRYLGDQDAIAAAMAEVAKQGEAAKI
ncbi:MAG: 2,3-diphosphoglycerate-dependent phosphoglycerate mutase [Phycisphaerales bacterium]|nr:2,3-diphosphoglycerate-dependent phosphoglycerate mutase [Phycisphaerales bacterium]